MLRAVALVSPALAFLALSAGAVHAAVPIQVCEATWVDHARADRAVPVRIRMPAGSARAPVILFSHGLGGSLDSGTDWVDAWADAGFITVNIQHAGSDSAVWQGQAHPLLAMRGAMNAAQLQARADDVHFVLDRLAKGGTVGGCDLARADMGEIGMAGHSFGAETTLAVSGGRYADAPAMRDPRIKASIAFSPQPSKGEDDRTAFGTIDIPVLTVTGTQDSFARFGGVSAQDRLRPYRAMPAGLKYLLVLDGATHLMLNGQALPLAAATPTPDMVGKIDTVTTLFWRETLMGDRTAATRMLGFGHGLPAKDIFAAK